MSKFFQMGSQLREIYSGWLYKVNAMEIVKICKKTWWIAVICQICQIVLPPKFLPYGTNIDRHKYVIIV